MTIAITRTEQTAASLRRHAARSDDAAVARRLLALALVLDGHKREDAARAAGMDRQTLRDWVHRYNADGLAGLSDRHAGGIKPRLSPEQEAEIADWMRAGPDVATNGVVRPPVAPPPAASQSDRQEAMALRGHPGPDRAPVRRDLARTERG